MVKKGALRTLKSNDRIDGTELTWSLEVRVTFYPEYRNTWRIFVVCTQHDDGYETKWRVFVAMLTGKINHNKSFGFRWFRMREQISIRGYEFKAIKHFKKLASIIWISRIIYYNRLNYWHVFINEIHGFKLFIFLHFACTASKKEDGKLSDK